jgi:hypothetical protein
MIILTLILYHERSDMLGTPPRRSGVPGTVNFEKIKKMSYEVFFTPNFVFLTYDTKNIFCSMKRFCEHIEHRDVCATFFVIIFQNFTIYLKCI